MILVPFMLLFIAVVGLSINLHQISQQPSERIASPGSLIAGLYGFGLLYAGLLGLGAGFMFGFNDCFMQSCSTAKSSAWLTFSLISVFVSALLLLPIGAHIRSGKQNSAFFSWITQTFAIYVVLIPIFAIFFFLVGAL